MLISSKLTTALGIAYGGTSLTSIAKGSVLAANGVNTYTALDGATASDQGTNVTGILAYKSSNDTVTWTTSIDGGTF